MVSDLIILFAVSELAGIVKTGGLADVAGALGTWMRRMGHDVRVIMPAYRQALSALATDVVGVGQVMMGKESLGFAVRQGEFDGVPVYLIEQNQYFDRSGLYTHNGESFGDNTRRFAFFCRAVLETCHILGFRPDIIHGHDWPSAMLPYYLKTREGGNPFFADTRSVLTIHNGAYQQHTDAGLLDWLGIDRAYFQPGSFEDYGQINILKGGIAFADKVTTVSPNYARELLTDQGSHGLVDSIRSCGRDFSGILNGCDYQHWDPARDPLLPERYSPENRSGKAVCKQVLQERVKLPVCADRPVYGLVSRLTEQKGFACLVPALWSFLHKSDVQVVLQGSGDPAIAAALSELVCAFPDRCRFVQAYDNAMAHLIEAGSDFFLMPSLFEPCGLNQMYSMKYGTLPVVRAVGGLVDTVVGYDFGDCAVPESVGKMSQKSRATGFMFGPPEPEALLNCLQKTLVVYQDKALLNQLIDNAMAQSFTWKQSAQHYIKVYHSK